MALYPFILLREREFLKDAALINHERIHHRQQLELLLLPFYLLYLSNYIFNRFRYHTHQEAYRNIIFEREAYSNDMDPDYLKKRKWFASFHYRQNSFI